LVVSTNEVSHTNASTDLPWQEVSPESEEFSVMMPAPPHVSRGTIYFYLNRDVLVDFTVYSLVHEHTLFVIQSYESSKPKDLVKDLFWSRRKGFKFGGDLQSNGHRGKSFAQTGESFVDTGRYFIAQRHLYIVDSARRDLSDSNMGQFLNSFTIRGTNKPAIPLTVSQTSSDAVYSGKEITRKVIVLSKQEPGFTPDARASHVTGNVTLRARFSSSGLVNDVVVLSGLPKGLTEQAIEASKTIIFIPADKDGKPVSQNLELTYSFMLYP